MNQASRTLSLQAWLTSALILISLAAQPSLANAADSTNTPSNKGNPASAASPDFEPKIGKVFSENTVNLIFEMLRQGLTAVKNKQAQPELTEEQKKNLAQIAENVQTQTSEMGLEMLKHNEQAFKEMFKDMK